VSSLSRQTPVFGHVPGDEGGEFVFAARGEEEFLSEESRQLDGEAIRLNADLERVRKAIDEKKARNEELRRQILAVEAGLVPAGKLDGGASAFAVDAGALSAPLVAAVGNTQARREVERGMGLFRERRYAEAAQAFEAALKINPNHVLAANNLGFTYFRLDRFADAITWYERTLVLDPMRALAYANVGDAYVKAGRTADAKRAYQKFLELQPTHKIALSVRQRLEALP
jgi:tetratricopeptide (TPR) repeat protein